MRRISFYTLEFQAEGLKAPSIVRMIGDLRRMKGQGKI